MRHLAFQARISARPGRSLAVLVTGAALLLSACGGGSTTSPSTAPSPVATAAPSAAEVPSAAPSATPVDMKDVKIGYLSGGDADPFVFLVTTSIKAAAQGAGVELVSCNSNFDDTTALNCARTLGTQGAQSVINWHFTAATSPALCTAYNDVPTVALDTTQDPCQKSFVGADGHTAGVVAGSALGDFTKTKSNCEFDLYVSIVNLNLPDVVTARDGGSREGFESVCGAIPADKYVTLNKTDGGADRQSNIRRIFTDILTTHPDARNVLVMASFGDGDGITAFEAAKAAGRDADVWIATHGADPSACNSIRNNDHWVGSVAYFPEQYGGLAVPAAIKLALGEPVEENIFVEHKFINKDSIDEFYPACS